MGGLEGPTAFTTPAITHPVPEDRMWTQLDYVALAAAKQNQMSSWKLKHQFFSLN